MLSGPTTVKFPHLPDFKNEQLPKQYSENLKINTSIQHCDLTTNNKVANSLNSIHNKAEDQ